MAKKKVDFTGIEAGGTKMKEGVQRVRISKAEFAESQAGDDMLVLTYQNREKQTIKDRVVLNETGLWKLKSIYLALGMKADGRAIIDTDKLEGKSLTINVYHDDKYANVDSAGYAPADAAKEEKPAKKSPAKAKTKPAPKRKGKPAPVEEDDDDDWDEEDDEDEEDDDLDDDDDDWDDED